MDDPLSKCSQNFQFVDEFTFYAFLRYPDFYISAKNYIDWCFGLFLLIGILTIFSIVKRGFWKLKFIENNKKLIKDEDWKNIHMKIPRIIVLLCLYALGLQALLILL